MRSITSHPVRLLAAAVATLALLISGCSNSSQAAERGFTLRVGFISTTGKPAGPEGWAAHRGKLLNSLKPAGVDALKWVPFKNGPDLSAALAGGSLDLATVGDTPGLTAKANGIGTRLINQSTVGLDMWLFAAKGGPRSIAELRGKTVATQVGSYMYRALVALLDQAGITDTVKITHIYTANAVAALRSGNVAAYAAPAGVLTAAMQQQGFPLLTKTSTEHRGLLGTSVTVISTKALQAHPKLPKAWNTARTAAVTDMQAHPAGYYRFAADATGTTPAVVRTATPISIYPAKPFTSEGLRLLEGTNRFLATHRLSKAAVDITTWRAS